MANSSLSEVSTPLLSKAPQAEGEASSKSESVKPTKTVLKFQDVGVWTIMTEVNAMASWKLPGREMMAQGREIVAIFPIVYHFLQECFSVSPWMMIVYQLFALWSSTVVNIFNVPSALLPAT